MYFSFHEAFALHKFTLDIIDTCDTIIIEVVIMKEASRIINEANISKVSVAKFLGVSRQMLYNYLALEKMEDLPKDKQAKLFMLFGAEKEEELSKIKVDDNYISLLEARINEGILDTFNKESISDLKGLNKKEQTILTDIFTLLKDKLLNDHDEIEYNTLRYLLMYLQNMEQMDELRYILAYMAKSTAQIPVFEYIYDEDKQYIFEGIFYSAETLFSNGNASRNKVAESHKKWEKRIEQKKEDKLSRTQELTHFKQQALKELGYNCVNESNAKEVFEKIAEIMSRKI